MLHQLAGDARVLAGHRVAAPQRLDRAQGDVAQVANRRRDDVEAGSQRGLRGFDGNFFGAHANPMNQGQGTQQV